MKAFRKARKKWCSSSLVSSGCLVVCILDGVLECKEAMRMGSFAKVCFLSGRTEYFFRGL